MATDEGFLRRWARRKQAAKAAEAVELRPPDPAPPPAVPEPEQASEPSAIRDAAPGIAAGPAPALELPPLESLTGSSDFTAFLQNGVSAELQSRALRVAWESDERIAGFRGMAEYAWDFNAPDYGKLWATDDVAKMVQQALRGAVPAEPEEGTAPAPGDTPALGETPGEEPALAVAQAPVDPALAAAGDAVAEGPTGGGAVVTPSEVGVSARAFAPDGPSPAAEDIAPRIVSARRHGSALPG